MRLSNRRMFFLVSCFAFLPIVTYWRAFSRKNEKSLPHTPTSPAPCNEVEYRINNRCDPVCSVYTNCDLPQHYICGYSSTEEADRLRLIVESYAKAVSFRVGRLHLSQYIEESFSALVCSRKKQVSPRSAIHNFALLSKNYKAAKVYYQFANNDSQCDYKSSRSEVHDCLQIGAHIHIIYLCSGYWSMERPFPVPSSISRDPMSYMRDYRPSKFQVVASEAAFLFYPNTTRGDYEFNACTRAASHCNSSVIPSYCLGYYVEMLYLVYIANNRDVKVGKGTYKLLGFTNDTGSMNRQGFIVRVLTTFQRTLELLTSNNSLPDLWQTKTLEVYRSYVCHQTDTWEKYVKPEIQKVMTLMNRGFPLMYVEFVPQSGGGGSAFPCDIADKKNQCASNVIVLTSLRFIKMYPIKSGDTSTFTSMGHETWHDATGAHDFVTLKIDCQVVASSANCSFLYEGEVKRSWNKPGCMGHFFNQFALDSVELPGSTGNVAEPL